MAATETFSLRERFVEMAGSLSNRLLTLTALWVTFIGLLLAYTVVLGWQLEAGSTAINRLENMKTLVYRLNVSVDRASAPTNYDIELRQFVDELRHLESGDDWQGFDLIIPKPDPSQIQDINNAWLGHILPLFTQAKESGRAVSSVKFGYFIDKMEALQKTILCSSFRLPCKRCRNEKSLCNLLRRSRLG